MEPQKQLCPPQSSLFWRGDIEHSILVGSKYCIIGCACLLVCHPRSGICIVLLYCCAWDLCAVKRTSYVIVARRRRTVQLECKVRLVLSCKYSRTLVLYSTVQYSTIIAIWSKNSQPTTQAILMVCLPPAGVVNHDDYCWNAWEWSGVFVCQ